MSQEQTNRIHPLLYAAAGLSALLAVLSFAILLNDSFSYRKFKEQNARAPEWETTNKSPNSSHSQDAPYANEAEGKEEAASETQKKAKLKTQLKPNERIGPVVSSKKGAKYHHPECGSAKSIKPENIVKYPTAADALKAGLSPSLNCKVLFEEL